MRIGIISIGMIVLLIASTIPAVTAINEDPKIEINPDVDNPNIYEIKFIRFNDVDEYGVGDHYDITITKGWSESNIYYQVLNEGIVYDGNSDTDHVRIELENGPYTIKAECAGIVKIVSFKI